MSSPIGVAVLGATGLVGQYLVARLRSHPWFELEEVIASTRSAETRYADAVRWIAPGTPGRFGDLPMKSASDGIHSRVVLSALPSGAAHELEPSLAAAGAVVCTNASAHRLDPGVPLVVPEVNGELIEPGRSRGAIVANPNCVVAALTLVLAAIEARWGLARLVVVTQQALSGGGLNGPTALGTLGNVIPWIEGEEEKIGAEVRKVFGRQVPIAVTATRVPVEHGHTAHVVVETQDEADAADVRQALGDFRGVAPPYLPSLPEYPLAVHRERDRPQPRLDAAAGDGMTVSVGRIRNVEPRGVALTLVSHNAVRGAAGACLANAELCASRGWIKGLPPCPP